MPNTGTTATEALSTATKNFLSLFNAGNTNGGGLSALFQSLLTDVQNSDVSAKALQHSNSKSTSTNNTSQNNQTTDDSPSNPTQALGQIVSALHQFNAKWVNYQDKNSPNHSSSKNTSTTDTTNGNTSSPNTSVQASQATQSNTNTTQSSQNGPTGNSAPSGNDTSTDRSNTNSGTIPTLSDLAAQLQSIMTLLQNIPAANQSAVTTDANTNNNDSTQSINDLIAAANALGDLLGLAQKFEKNSDPISGGNAAMNGNADLAMNGDSTNIQDIANLDAKLKADLQNMLDALKAAAKNSLLASSTSPKDQSNAKNSDAQMFGALSEATASNPTPAIPFLQTDATNVANASDIIKGTVAAANDFLKQLNNLYAPPGTTPMVAPTNSSSITALNQSGNGTDTDLDDQPNTTLANANTPKNDVTPVTLGETAKSSNPYSFASQLSATRAQNGGTTGLPTAVEQVLLQLSKNVKSGNDQMSVQLHPADLGTINIKLDFASNGSVSGTVTANNADTLAMLQKDSRSLERALQEAGLRADPGSLQFSLGGQQNPNNSGQAGYNSSSGSSAANTLADTLASLTDGTEDENSQSWIISPGRVNIKV